MLFYGFLLNFGCVFRTLARVLGKSWKQRFCNAFFAKSQISRACWFNILCILAHFSRTLSESVVLIIFGVFRCHFWLTCGAKGCFRSGFGGIEQIMQKRVWGNKKMGMGGPYNNLWSVAILGHSASWSLVVAKGQRGSGWELVTPCARSAVADLS